jgi:hypothetical protein
VRHFLAQVCDNADAICAATGADVGATYPVLPPGGGNGASASDAPTRVAEGGVPSDLQGVAAHGDGGASRVDGGAVRGDVAEARARVAELLAVAGLASGDGGAGSVLVCLLRHGWADEFSLVGSILTAGQFAWQGLIVINRLVLTAV